MSYRRTDRVGILRDRLRVEENILESLNTEQEEMVELLGYIGRIESSMLGMRLWLTTREIRKREERVGRLELKISVLSDIEQLGMRGE